MSSIFADDILQGKVAFVTGGGTGITGGVARAFAEHGAKLAITSRTAENLEAMKQTIEGFGGECLAVPADVRDYAEVEAAILKTVDYYGKIDGQFRGLMVMSAAHNGEVWSHSRDYGVLVANPFARKAFTKGEASKVVVRKGETFRLRFGVLVHSGKGGVGKSTVATNLAVGLQREGFRVGLLDADVYGPSFSKMMDIR